MLVNTLSQQALPRYFRTPCLIGDEDKEDLGKSRTSPWRSLVGTIHPAAQFSQELRPVVFRFLEEKQISRLVAYPPRRQRAPPLSCAALCHLSPFLFNNFNYY
jgi:hypothetical protein